MLIWNGGLIVQKRMIQKISDEGLYTLVVFDFKLFDQVVYSMGNPIPVRLNYADLNPLNERTLLLLFLRIYHLLIFYIKRIGIILTEHIIDV